ncbi:hypothetical protein FRC12_024740 [Ceratobasidium sp. 428]|nr:hypothetical protein FRC12_024740 [Ceratobasidium sp. 428]
MLLNRCWAFNPKFRATASEVKEVMAKITPEGLAHQGSAVKRGASLCDLGDDAAVRKRVKVDRATNVVQELLLTERKYLETLERIQTEYRPTALPALIEELELVVENSRAFVEYLESDLSVQGACNAFLAVEERLETAFVRWSIFVPSTTSWIRSEASSNGIDEPDDHWFNAIMPTERASGLALSYHQIELYTPSASSIRPLVERALQAAKRIAERCREAEVDPDDILPPVLLLHLASAA